MSDTGAVNKSLFLIKTRSDDSYCADLRDRGPEAWRTAGAGAPWRTEKVRTTRTRLRWRSRWRSVSSYDTGYFAEYCIVLLQP